MADVDVMIVVVDAPSSAAAAAGTFPRLSPGRYWIRDRQVLQTTRRLTGGLHIDQNHDLIR